MRVRWRIWWIMALVAIVAIAIGVARQFGAGWMASYAEWQKNRPIYAALGQPVALKLSPDVPLEDVLKAVMLGTRSPGVRGGIPVFVDPVGLQEAGVDMATLVTITDSKVPLGTSLRDALKSLKLGYSVQGGLMTITSLKSLGE